MVGLLILKFFSSGFDLNLFFRVFRIWPTNWFSATPKLTTSFQGVIARARPPLDSTTSARMKTLHCACVVTFTPFSPPTTRQFVSIVSCDYEFVCFFFFRLFCDWITTGRGLTVHAIPTGRGSVTSVAVPVHAVICFYHSMNKNQINRFFFPCAFYRDQRPKPIYIPLDQCFPTWALATPCGLCYVESGHWGFIPFGRAVNILRAAVGICPHFFLIIQYWLQKDISKRYPSYFFNRWPAFVLLLLL